MNDPRPMATRDRCVVETRLTDGTPVCLRPVHAGDAERLRTGILGLSDRSRYLRFFSGFREPPAPLVQRLVDVDGHAHIAWGALDLSDPAMPAIGAARAIRLAGEGEGVERDGTTAEFSIAVLDAYHGRGLARMLIAALLLDCRDEGVVMLDMHVLAENRPAILLVDWLQAERAPGVDVVIRYSIDVARALDRLASARDVAGINAVFAALA